MALEKLSAKEQETVRHCIRAIADGQYIEDPEFKTRLGIDRLTLRRLLGEWPHLDDSKSNSDVFLAINNCLNEVCYGVDIPPEDWGNWFNETQDEVRQTYRDWAYLQGLSHTGIA